MTRWYSFQRSSNATIPSVIGRDANFIKNFDFLSFDSIDFAHLSLFIFEASADFWRSKHLENIEKFYRQRLYQSTENRSMHVEKIQSICLTIARHSLVATEIAQRLQITVKQLKFERIRVKLNCWIVLNQIESIDKMIER